MRGDILVTRTKGHTVVALNDGAKSCKEPVSVTYRLGDRVLKNGMAGADVKELQGMLIRLEYDCGAWGADGEFGDSTQNAVRKFQKEHDCDVDGKVGPETLGALNAVFNAQGDEGENLPGATKVRIVNGKCYVRGAPNTGSKILGVVNEGSVHPYQGQTSENGWNLIEYSGQNGWVSGRYSELYAGGGINE